MLTPDRTETLRLASASLARYDPVMARLVKRYGPCTIEPHSNYYQALVSSIISQQLSVKVADTIERRFIDMFGGVFPEAGKILEKSPLELKTAGLSLNKALYIQDLARQIVDGTLTIDGIETLSNEQIIADLTQVKGIGVWTVHMFLIFSLGRLDVLATGDLGVRNAIHSLYPIDVLPSQSQVIKIADANHWQPYASVACWYLWRSLDNKPSI